MEEYFRPYQCYLGKDGATTAATPGILSPPQCASYDARSTNDQGATDTDGNTTDAASTPIATTTTTTTRGTTTTTTTKTTATTYGGRITSHQAHSVGIS